MNIARRYARGLFALGGRDRTHDLGALGEVFTQLLTRWQNPSVPMQVKKNLVTEIAAGVAPDDMELRQLLLLLVANRRERLLPEIAAEYTVLMQKKMQIVEVRVTSSHTLDSKQTEEIKKTVAAKLQKKINVEFVVDTDILGGLIIAWDHKVWDFSLKTKLQVIVQHATG